MIVTFKSDIGEQLMGEVTMPYHRSKDSKAVYIVNVNEEEHHVLASNCKEITTHDLKMEALLETKVLIEKSWLPVYEASAGEMEGPLYEIRMGINQLQVNINNAIAKLKEETK